AFERDSDTEVLLRAYQHWGEDVVHQLRGMFAFAVWDARRQQLYLARDRYGEKPLYLRQEAGGLFFASEIKALLKLPLSSSIVDPEAVWDYLAYRYVPGPRTLLRGIRKLLPGTYGIWSSGRLQQVRYWVPPDRDARDTRRENDDPVGGFLTRLDSAVASQMVSDVPFGAFLSGGLDSSMIVALMTRHCDFVRTYSVGFADKGYSELPFAAQVASEFGTEHHALHVTPRDIMDALPPLVGFRDAPVSEPSDIAIHLLAKEASRSVKMVLTGEGSDEILGGYPKHVWERFTPGYQWLPSAVREGLVAPLAAALPYRFRRVKTLIANFNIDDRCERYVRWFGALSNDERRRLARLPINGYAYAPPLGLGNAAPPFDSAEDNSRLRRLLYFDQTSWLPDNLLERGDRMSMAASIEARVPFLDHELGAYVSSLPDRYRVRGLRTKWLLRQAGQRILPKAILTRPKVGFRVPVNEWFRGELRGFLLDHLKGTRSITRDYYEPSVLDRLLAEHMEGRHNHEKLLWTLLNLEIWHRQYAPH
ncbi:MAG TPA: asparagine synthase (glutamine-hydrolyzing), partial [Rhodocyclaceae bacterium]|nr:asparagine synthase (glutamine-hydrolyzing) [Rhodocyclaceae bacterium]